MDNDLLHEASTDSLKEAAIKMWNLQRFSHYEGMKKFYESQYNKVHEELKRRKQAENESKPNKRK